MAKAPVQQPLLDIPGIEEATKIDLHVQGRGKNLGFKMYVEGKEVKLDPDNDRMDRDWYGMVIRELDRRDWHYSVQTGADDTTIFRWTNT